MRFHILTLFPEMVEDCLNTSIIGRAIKNGNIELNVVNIRDFATNKHHKVDDYPYGGGAGMVMQAEPVYLSYKSIEEKICQLTDAKPRVIYMTPQGNVFNQRMAEKLSEEEDLVFLCGHYEGIDQRVLDKIVDEEVSIGDYVLTGGEIPAMVLIDSVSRYVEGVLNKESIKEESFSNGLLEYPQYTRPEVFEGKKVPDILLSGNHQNIDKWRKQKSLEITKSKRPDLLLK